MGSVVRRGSSLRRDDDDAVASKASPPIGVRRGIINLYATTMVRVLLKPICKRLRSYLRATSARTTTPPILATGTEATRKRKETKAGALSEPSAPGQHFTSRKVSGVQCAPSLEGEQTRKRIPPPEGVSLYSTHACGPIHGVSLYSTRTSGRYTGRESYEEAY